MAASPIDSPRSGLLQHPLQAAEPVHRERTLRRVVAARVEEHHDRRTAVERVRERELGSSVVLKPQAGDVAHGSGRRRSSSLLSTTARVRCRRRAVVSADRLERLPHHRRCRGSWILREQILQPRHTRRACAAEPADGLHDLAHRRRRFATGSESTVVRQPHDLVPMLDVEHRRQQRFREGRRWLGILPQDVGGDGRQPGVVRTLQFLEDKWECGGRQRAMTEREQQRTAHPRDRRRADTAIDGMTLVEQFEKRLRERAVSSAGLDDADEVGLGANARVSPPDSPECFEVLGQRPLGLGRRLGCGCAACRRAGRPAARGAATPCGDSSVCCRASGER